MIPCVILWNFVTPCDTMWHHASSCDPLKHHASSCDTLRHHATLCYRMWHYPTPRHIAIPCVTTQKFVALNRVINLVLISVTVKKKVVSIYINSALLQLSFFQLYVCFSLKRFDLVKMYHECTVDASFFWYDYSRYAP